MKVELTTADMLRLLTEHLGEQVLSATIQVEAPGVKPFNLSLCDGTEPWKVTVTTYE